MVSGFSLALLLRVLSGEPVLGFEAILRFPGYVEGDSVGAVGFQNFPFRLTIMLLHFAVSIGVTFLTDFLHQRGVKVDPLENYKFRTNGSSSSSSSSTISDDDSLHRTKVIANAAAVKFEQGEITITTTDNETSREKIEGTRVCSVLALVGVGAGIKSLSHLVN
eukprot:sb/3472612/